MKGTRYLLARFRAKMSDMKNGGREKVQQWHRRSQQESELLTVVRVGDRTVPILPLSRAETRRKYASSNLSACSASNVIVLTEVEKNVSHDVWPSERRRNGIIVRMCINCALKNILRQSIHDTLIHAAQNNVMLWISCSSCWFLAFY